MVLILLNLSCEFDIKYSDIGLISLSFATLFEITTIQYINIKDC